MKKLGFSLIELVVVLAIIGILAAIAIPSYQSHLVKVRRSQAKTTLLDCATQLENFYMAQHSYHGANINIPNNEFYTFKADITNDYSYVCYAIPTQVQNDKLCGILSYNSNGQKNSAGDINQCW